MSSEPDLRPEAEAGPWDIAILRQEAEKLCTKHLRAARLGTMLDLPLVLLSTYGQALLSAFALAEVILLRHDPLLAGVAAFVAAVLGIMASLGRHQDRYRQRVHRTSIFAELLVRVRAATDAYLPTIYDEVQAAHFHSTQLLQLTARSTGPGDPAGRSGKPIKKKAAGRGAPPPPHIPT